MRNSVYMSICICYMKDYPFHFTNYLALIILSNIYICVCVCVCCPLPCPQNQGCQFRFVLPGMAETFHTNSKNGTNFISF